MGPWGRRPGPLAFGGDGASGGAARGPEVGTAVSEIRTDAQGIVTSVHVAGAQADAAGGAVADDLLRRLKSRRMRVAEGAPGAPREGISDGMSQPKPPRGPVSDAEPRSQLGDAGSIHQNSSDSAQSGEPVVCSSVGQHGLRSLERQRRSRASRPAHARLGKDALGRPSCSVLPHP